MFHYTQRLLTHDLCHEHHRDYYHSQHPLISHQFCWSFVSTLNLEQHSCPKQHDTIASPHDISNSHICEQIHRSSSYLRIQNRTLHPILTATNPFPFSSSTSPLSSPSRPERLSHPSQHPLSLRPAPGPLPTPSLGSPQLPHLPRSLSPAAWSLRRGARFIS